MGKVDLSKVKDFGKIGFEKVRRRLERVAARKSEIASLETLNETLMKRTATGAFNETIPMLVESQSSVHLQSDTSPA